MDFCSAIAETWKLNRLDGFSPAVQKRLRENIYTSFSAIIWIITHKIKKSSDRIDIIDSLKQQAPDLWFNNGKKQKIDSFMYRYLPHLFIRLRYIYDNTYRK